ncbi:MAG: tetratricopeptide repeat protein, partial [Myxococcota bacterium]
MSCDAGTTKRYTGAPCGREGTIVRHLASRALPQLAVVMSLWLVAPPSGATSTPARADEVRVQELMFEGKIAYRQERYDDAAEHFSAAHRLLPAFAVALFNEAIALHQAARYDDASDAFGRHLELYPNDTEPLYSLGRSAEVARDPAAARRWYEAYLLRELGEAQIPRREDAAQRLVKLSGTKEARATLQQAPPPPACRAIADDTARRWSMKYYCEASNLYLDGSFSEAEASFRALAQGGALGQAPALRRGLSLREMGEGERALAPLESVATARGDEAYPLFLLGDTAFRTGRREEAKRWLVEYLRAELRPEEAPFVARARRLLRQLGGRVPRVGGARGTAPVVVPGDDLESDAAAMPQVPRSLAARALLASARRLHSSGKPGHAIRDYEQVLALAPDDLTARRELEALEEGLRDPRVPAIEAPAFIDLLTLGEAHLAKGDGRAALDAFQGALLLAPGSSRVHHGLMRTYELLGDAPRAVAHYREYRRSMGLAEGLD